MEPINGSSGGAISPPDGYWIEAQEILRANDILLIADEVMTGFGRVGYDFASNLYGIEPDILIAGKGMGGGYAAIGGTYSTDKIADSIQECWVRSYVSYFCGITTILRCFRRGSKNSKRREAL